MRIRVFLTVLLAGALAAASGAACGGSGREQIDAAPWVIVDGGPDGATFPDAAPSPKLRIDYVEPDHGSFAGGTEVIIHGRGFEEGMAVTFDGRAVEVLDLTIIDERRALVLTPPGDPGPADLAVAAGGLTAEAPAGYDYEAIYVDPPAGSVAGGTYVRINGFGTAFTDSDTVTFDGQELLSVTRISDQELVGFTPPGVAGDTDVIVDGVGGMVRADDAYVYLSSADPFAGGFGGGPIMGALNIAVVDAFTQDGVPDAYVTVNDPATTPFQGFCDPFGQITFSAPDFTGPVTVTAGKTGYERTAMVVFDARDVTIFLVPLPDPMPGTFPPGRANGLIRGAIVFGGPTGIGVPTWDLVPPPRTATEIKRAYVYTTIANPFSGNPQPGALSVVDYVNDGRVAWEFEVVARPAALAVYAVAGLYDPDIDPDGAAGPLPPGVFEPFALGAARGILVGPGEVVADIDVLVDIPLDTAVQVELVSPPPLGTPGWAGPTEYQVQAFIDLGGEGVISLPNSKASALEPSILLPGLAPISSSISDGAYTVFAGAYTNGGANPYSVRVVRGIDDLGAPLIVTDFLGVPRPIDPPATGATGAAMHLQWAAEGPVTGAATFSVHRMQLASDGTPLWRVFARGDQFDVPLYDLVTTGGVPPTPSPDALFWSLYMVTIPGSTFDEFNYRQLNANYWSAYSVDVFNVSLPANP